jgi:hypothetical protein
MFLEDGKLQEEVCIEKYKNYSDKKILNVSFLQN